MYIPSFHRLVKSMYSCVNKTTVFLRKGVLSIVGYQLSEKQVLEFLYVHECQPPFSVFAFPRFLQKIKLTPREDNYYLIPCNGRRSPGLRTNLAPTDDNIKCN